MPTVLQSQRKNKREETEHTILYVRLADDEWASKGDCSRVARLALEQHRADIIYVIEHSGWYEIYVSTPGHGVVCIATANDCAIWSAYEARLRCEYLSNPRYVGSIESADLVTQTDPAEGTVAP